MRIEGLIAATGAATHQMATHEVVNRPERERAQQEKSQLQTASHPQDQTSQSKATGEKLLSTAVQQAQEIVHAFDQQVTFDIHRETHSTIIRVVNHSTGEVVREIPAEKFLDMLASFQKQLAGLFVDETK